MHDKQRIYDDSHVNKDYTNGYGIKSPPLTEVHRAVVEDIHLGFIRYSGQKKGKVGGKGIDRTRWTYQKNQTVLL